jgi:hypothetical protein
MSIQGNFFDREGEPISHMEWARLFFDDDYRSVAVSLVDDDLPLVVVSTVWLGIGISGGLFETMVFGGPDDEKSWRWPKMGAALAGHDQVLAMVKDHVRR